MKRIRLAMVTQFPRDPERPQGGVEAVSVHLARGLARFDDLELDIVTFDEQCRQPERQESGEGYTLHRLPRGDKSTLTFYTGEGRQMIHAYLRDLAPDVVHAHDTYGLATQGLTLPRVFTIHGFIHGDTLLAGDRLAWLRARIWKVVEERGWADQPNIISISPYVRERLTGITRARIYDIDNPISARFFEIERDERKGTLFSAAVINRRKNPLVLIEAVKRLRDEGMELELRLAGTVTEQDYGEQVERYIAEHGLQEQVKLLGRLSIDQIREELARASLFALVSLEENSPMGIEEAMAAGVPVVTSNRCGMPYMVSDYETGFLVDPHDAADVALHLKKALADDELRRAMSEKARQVARERFHPDRVSARTHQVYLDCIERYRPA